jgi:hypothetical protein
VGTMTPFWDYMALTGPLLLLFVFMAFDPG